MLPQLTKYLIENWEAIFPKKKKPSKIDYLGILGSPEGGKISFLAFTDGEKKPIFIVKIARHSNGAKQLLNQRDGLAYLNSLNDFFKDSVPKIILCKMINNTWYLVESILEGKGMAVHLAENTLPNSKETEKNFSLAKNWLLKFNLATKKTVLVSDNFIQDYISQPIKEFQEIFNLNENEKGYLKKISDTFASYKGRTINLFFRHGDFCRHNILISDSKIKLIDWESSQRDSLPLYDVFLFIITYYQQLVESWQIDNRLNCFKRTFFEKNDYSNLVHQFIIDYCRELKIKESLIKIFFVIFLSENAIFEYQNLVELSERGFIPLLNAPGKYDEKAYLKEIKDQLWINFSRFLVKNDSAFIL